MQLKRTLRYLTPNLITLASLMFGLLAIRGAFMGDFVIAGWFILFAVCSDKLDGLMARLLRSASEFGVQLDSFADFLNFGVAPAVVWFAYFTGREDLPYTSGAGYAFMLAVSFFWVFSVTFRLARYNVVGDDPACKKVFFGAPTTLMGGFGAALFLACLRFSPDTPAGSFHGPALVSGELPHVVWLWWPAFILFGAVLMVSTMKIPKLGKSRWPVFTGSIVFTVVLGYVLIFGRLLPELLMVLSGSWLVGSMLWSTFAKEARSLVKPPPLFPKEDPPMGKMPHLPEDILEPEEPEDSPAKA